MVHVANMRRHEPYLVQDPLLVVLRLSGRVQGEVVRRATGRVDRSLFGPWSLLDVRLQRLYSL